MRRRGGSVATSATDHVGGFAVRPDASGDELDAVVRNRYRHQPKKKKTPRERGFSRQAAGLGFEPRLLGPEPSVLPLDDPATCRCGSGILARSGAIPGAAPLDRLALLRRAAGRPGARFAATLSLRS